MMQNFLQRMENNNPLYKRAQQMAEGKNEQELKQTAENLCKQKGIDLEQAYKEFQKFMGGMSR